MVLCRFASTTQGVIERVLAARIHIDLRGGIQFGADNSDDFENQAIGMNLFRQLPFSQIHHESKTDDSIRFEWPQAILFILQNPTHARLQKRH